MPRRSIAAFLRAFADAPASQRVAMSNKLDEVADCAEELEAGLAQAEAALASSYANGCPCVACAQRIARAGTNGCERCGFVGTPMATPCACGGNTCTPGDEEGCGVHGLLLCAVCANGEVDAYDLVRAAREGLERAAGALEAP